MAPMVSVPVPAEWPSSGPGRIAIVGEAPGEEEVLQGRPFVGSSGWLLNEALKRAGINRAECLVTNTFKLKPPGNDVSKFYVKTLEAKRLGIKDCPFPKRDGMGIPRPEHWSYIQEMRDEIDRFNPNVVIALGGTALWGLCGVGAIGKMRGTVQLTGAGRKVVPTWHPAAVLRQWELRRDFIADISKALRESETREHTVLERVVFTEPTLGDLKEFYREYIKPLCIDNRAPLAYDIETTERKEGCPATISCIGFAPSEAVALVIPFLDRRMPDYSYWPTVGQEMAAWAWVRNVLGDANIRKVSHNGTYDDFYLEDQMKMAIRGDNLDTMHMKHALDPEGRKSLDYLGSLYTDAGSWKLLRGEAKAKVSNKRDE